MHQLILKYLGLSEEHEQVAFYPLFSFFELPLLLTAYFSMVFMGGGVCSLSSSIAFSSFLLLIASNMV